jgi:hypothetical protein
MEMRSLHLNGFIPGLHPSNLVFLHCMSTFYFRLVGRHQEAGVCWKCPGDSCMECMGRGLNEQQRTSNKKALGILLNQLLIVQNQTDSARCSLFHPSGEIA